MFEKILIANRGEIAVRIIRARSWGLRRWLSIQRLTRKPSTPCWQMRLFCIGPARSTDSYLNMQAVISAGCDRCPAIHPGFGF